MHNDKFVKLISKDVLQNFFIFLFNPYIPHDVMKWRKMLITDDFSNK